MSTLSMHRALLPSMNPMPPMSADRLNTWSAPLTTSRHASRSVRSSVRFSTPTEVWYQRSSGLTSTARTSMPCLTRSATRWPPMNPPAPVTTHEAIQRSPCPLHQELVVPYTRSTTTRGSLHPLHHNSWVPTPAPPQLVGPYTRTITTGGSQSPHHHKPCTAHTFPRRYGFAKSLRGRCVSQRTVSYRDAPPQRVPGDQPHDPQVGSSGSARRAGEGPLTRVPDSGPP